MAQIDYKFNEKNLITEFQKYIDSTYNSHYSKDKFQATEFIIDGGHGTGFCIGNVLKYAQRYGKKGSKEDARKDLMKVLHYALIQLYVHDTSQQQVSTYTLKAILFLLCDIRTSVDLNKLDYQTCELQHLFE